MKPAKTSPDPGSRTVPVRAELADAVRAVAATAAFTARPEHMSPDALEQEPELNEGAWDLARGVALRALGLPGAPSAAEVRTSAAAQMEVIRDLSEDAALSMAGAAPEAIPEHLLAEATGVIRNAALEYTDHEMLLGTHAEEGLVLAASPVTRAQAYVWTLGPLYERLEAWVQGDELLALERMAAHWWFTRYTPERRKQDHEFARGVREQEFSLVARPCMALDGQSVLEFLAEDDDLDEFPPKRRHMAMQLLESEVGFWEVAERDGADAVFRSPLDGARYRVVEHAPDQRYDPGMIVAGRLIPFGDGTWLRSPGAIVFSATDPGQARLLAGALGGHTGNLPPEAKVEMVITTLAGRTRLPRSVLPAPGTREAREMLERLAELMRETGFTEELAADDLPPDLDLSLLPPGGTVVNYQVDAVLGEWMTALSALARKGEARIGAKRKKGGSKGKGKAQRRRR
jgi:hypothetical protein